VKCDREHFNCVCFTVFTCDRDRIENLLDCLANFLVHCIVYSAVLYSTRNVGKRLVFT
jgi:hypothetical protein